MRKPDGYPLETRLSAQQVRFGCSKSFFPRAAEFAREGVVLEVVQNRDLSLGLLLGQLTLAPLKWRFVVRVYSLPSSTSLLTAHAARSSR